MRVDQVITLVWAGNIALLGGTGWVGWKFWEQKKASREIVQTEWPESGEALPQMDRWPGPVDQFQTVWKTPLDGLVPPPPKPPEETKTVVETLEQRFRNRIKIVNAVAATNPAASILKVQSGGQELVVALGQIVDEWQLVSIRIDASKSQVIAGFTNPMYEKGVLVIEQAVEALKPIATEGAGRLIRRFEDAFSADAAKLSPDDAQGFLNPATGEWEIPEKETLWWEFNGPSEIVEKTKLVSRPQGIEIASLPPRGPLNNTRGITQGDILVSVNDVAVRTIEELYAYFRGEGRELTRFVVVIERDGARRTQVYNVARRRPVVPRRADGAREATIRDR